MSISLIWFTWVVSKIIYLEGKKKVIKSNLYIHLRLWHQLWIPVAQWVPYKQTRIYTQSSWKSFDKIWTHRMLATWRRAKCSGFSFTSQKLMQGLIKRNYRCKPTNIICQSFQEGQENTQLHLWICPTLSEGHQGLHCSQVRLPHNFNANSIIRPWWTFGGVIYLSRIQLPLLDRHSVFRANPVTVVSKEWFRN